MATGWWTVYPNTSLLVLVLVAYCSSRAVDAELLRMCTALLPGIACSQEEHDAAVKFTFPMFSLPMTHDQFLQKLAA